MKIRNPYTSYSSHIWIKSTKPKNLFHAQTVGTRSRHKINPATVLTIVMFFRVTREGINILSQTTCLKNTQTIGQTWASPYLKFRDKGNHGSSAWMPPCFENRSATEQILLLLDLNTFCAAAKLSFPRLYSFAHCSRWQHITACFCECDKEDLALEIHTVCEIPNGSSKGMDESYQVSLSHPVYRLRKTSQMEAEQHTTSLSQALRVVEINSMNENVLYDSLLWSRVPSKADIHPPILKQMFSTVLL